MRTCTQFSGHYKKKVKIVLRKEGRPLPFLFAFRSQVGMILTFLLPCKVVKEACYLFLFSTLRYMVVKDGKVVTASDTDETEPRGFQECVSDSPNGRGGGRGAIPITYTQSYGGPTFHSPLRSLVDFLGGGGYTGVMVFIPGCLTGGSVY